MQYTTRWLSAWCIILFLFTGCTSSNHAAKIVNVPDHKWKISRAVLTERNTSWLVTGELRSYNQFGLPDGYVEIKFVDENDKLLRKHKANYHRITSNAGRQRRHQFGVAVFYLEISEPPPNCNLVATLIFTET